MIKRIGLGLGAFVLLLVAVLLIRTFNYGGPHRGADIVELDPAPNINVERAAARLGEAIQFQTITLTAGDPRPGTEGPWLEMRDWMEATYPAFHAAATREIVPGGYTLLFTWQGSDTALDPLLLMAHQDVVPVNMGTQSDWEAPPFDGVVRDGYVYGRGTIDDKGSMVGLLEALDALARDGFQPQRTILLMLGHDEEVSGSGASSGVQLLKSRGVSPVMALDEGFMAVEDNPLTGGTVGYIGVAEKGYVTFEITVSAEGGHSSTPPRNSATVRLARALVALDENQMPADLDYPLVAGLFRSTGHEMPFAQRMAFANQWLFGGYLKSVLSNVPAANAMIRTTTAPTMLVGSAKENVLAQRATAIVNFRIHPRDTEEDILNHIKHVTRDIEGLEVKYGRTGIRGAGASNVSPMDNKAYAVLQAIASDVTDGAPVAPGLVLGATDGRYAEAITDSVYRFMPAIMTPDELTGFHGTNERISVENVGRLARGYAQLVLAMDKSE
ncbi:MAG: M20 family peptidase [Henriciella sp.]|nr:M20 family peptidase [Henriciella sp.]